MNPDLLEDYTDAIEAARDTEELERVIRDARDELGAQHLLYHWLNRAGEWFGVGTYSQEWREHYIAMGYARVDPVVQAAYQRFHPVSWKGLDWEPKAVRPLREDALAAGIGPQGLTIPIRGPGGQFAHITATMDVDDQDWARFTEENGRHLILLGHAVNKKALELDGTQPKLAEANLSPREVDALTFLAMGYSRAQAADTLSISQHTLRVYIEAARAKLGCANTTHAVVRAQALGILPLGSSGSVNRPVPRP